MRHSQIHRNFKFAAYAILLAFTAGIFKVLTVYGAADLTEFNTILGFGLNLMILFTFIPLALYVGQGAQWARITFAVFASCLLVFMPFSILMEFEASAVIGVFSTVYGLAMIGAMALMFSNGANRWYAQKIKAE